MDRVTYIQQGIALLQNLNFQVFTGEIMGLLPLDSVGIDVLIRCIRHNPKILYGHIYFKERLVNTYAMNLKEENNVMVINGGNNLTESLSAADNVFALRTGFRSVFIKESLLRNQLQLLLDELNLNIRADKPIKEMTSFEKYVITILKAVVGKCDLIILQDPGSFLYPIERKKLLRIIKYYAAQDISFIYISAQLEELTEVSDRISVMSKGSIMKVIDRSEFHQIQMKQWALPGQAAKNTEKKEEYVFSCRDVKYKSIRKMSFKIKKGECFLIHNYGDLNDEDFISVLCGGRLEGGEIQIRGERYTKKDRRKLAVILENPTENMLFKGISYADNLCITTDNRIRGIWFQEKKKQSVVREMFGAVSVKRKVKDMTIRQKYELIYNRVLLQRPDVVFCFYPYRNIDVGLREHIDGLMKRLLDQQIAVVIITVNFRDTLDMADRILLLKNGTTHGILERKEAETIAGLSSVYGYMEDIYKKE